MKNKYAISESAITISAPTGRLHRHAQLIRLGWLFSLLFIGQSMICLGQTGTTVAGGHDAGSAANQLNNPAGIFVTANGVVYVADYDNNRVQKWAVGATSGVTVAGGNNAGMGANQLNHPFGIYVDGSETIYIADAGNHRVQKWTAGATSGVTVAGGHDAGKNADQLYSPTGIYVTANGTIYIADFLNDRIQKWEPGATAGVTVAGGHNEGDKPNQLRHPEGVAVDETTGAVYVADTYNHRIQRWDVNASEGVTVAGSTSKGSTATQLDTPFALYRDNNGDIYVTDTYNHRIQKFPANSTSGTPGVTVAGGQGAGPNANQLATPEGVFLDDNKRIYVSDHANHRVQRFGLCTNPVAGLGKEMGLLTCVKTSIQLTATSSIPGVTYTFSGPAVSNPNGNTAYATQPGQYTVVVLNTNNGCLSTATTDVSANTTPPQNVALANNGPLSVNNSPVTLTASSDPTGGISYAFSPDATQQNGGNTATVTTSGTFSVTATRTDNGCKTPASTTVLGANSPTICRGGAGTIKLTVASNPTKYEWYQQTPYGFPLYDNTLYQGATTANLTIKGGQQDNVYYAKVYYADGSSATYGPYRLTINRNCNGRLEASLEPGTELRLTLLGNPLQGEQLRAIVQGAEGQSLRIDLLDVSGRPVRQQSWESAEREQAVEWNLGGSGSGVYLLQAVSDQQRQVRKVVKP